MPLIYVDCPQDTFTPEAQNALDEEMTVAVLSCSGGSYSVFAVDSTWIHFRPHPLSPSSPGEKLATSPEIFVEMNVFEGELDSESKDRLVCTFTDCIRRRAVVIDDEIYPVYVTIREAFSATRNTSAEASTVASQPGSPVERSIQ